MSQPGKGSAGKPNVAEPRQDKGAHGGAHQAPGSGGIVPPVGIIKGTHGK